MKLKIQYKAILGLAALMVGSFVACDTNKDLISENNKFAMLDTLDVGFVKIVNNHAAVTPQIPGAAANTGPQVFLYANGVKVNGNNLGYAGIYPATTVYSALKSGSTEFTVILARLNTTVVPNIPAPIAGDTLLRFTQSIEKGKYYSVMLTDTLPSMKAVVYEDDLNLPAAKKFKIRLINNTMNPLDTLVLYSRLQKANIIGNTLHKKASSYVELDVPTLNDTLEVRSATGTAALYYVGSQTAPQAFLPVWQRIYTIVARGKTGLTSKTPSASLVTNR